MTFIAAFDIGTTQTKGVLVAKDGTIHHETNIPMTTIQKGDTIEQDPRQWLQAVINIAAKWFRSGVRAEEIHVIALTGQMQDCILIDQAGESLRPAILYADGRATTQAEQMKQRWGDQAIQMKTGNHLNGLLVLPKIQWLQEEEEEWFRQVDCILISPKDYVIRHLTGKKVTDPTTASTTGMMDIQKCEWISDWLEEIGVSERLLPQIVRSDQLAGNVTPQAAIKTGFAAGTPVVCGIGDAGAATIGANVSDLGEVYAYIGTSGWMATITDHPQLLPEGVFHLAFVEENEYIVAPPISNAGIVHKWVRSIFFHDQEDDQEAYQQLEKEIQAIDPSQNSLLFLPYLQGERFPVHDQAATGMFIGLKSSTTHAEMSYAALEGVAMAIRQGMEQIAPQQTFHQLTLIGGGSKSDTWNQIFADVLNLQVLVPADSHFLPSKGVAALGAKYLGWCQELSEFVTASTAEKQVYQPNSAIQAHLNQKYARYLQLYDAYKQIF
mgnify:CR=1 FL=1